MDGGSRLYKIRLQKMSLEDFLEDADDYGDGHIFIHECVRRLREYNKMEQALNSIANLGLDARQCRDLAIRALTNLTG